MLWAHTYGLGADKCFGRILMVWAHTYGLGADVCFGRILLVCAQTYALGKSKSKSWPFFDDGAVIRRLANGRVTTPEWRGSSAGAVYGRRKSSCAFYRVVPSLTGSGFRKGPFRGRHQQSYGRVSRRKMFLSASRPLSERLSEVTV